LHRQHEQRVNYFKSKVKNLVTNENARIANLNADIQNEASKKNNNAQAEYQNLVAHYKTLYVEATEKTKNIHAEFEKERQAKIKEIAAMRISVDARFQPVVDIFLKQISAVQE